jgi:hypothetical protein
MRPMASRSWAATPPTAPTTSSTPTRGVCRAYEMSIGNGDWRLSRHGAPFPQRFTGHIADVGSAIVERWLRPPPTALTDPGLHSKAGSLAEPLEWKTGTR